MFEPRESGSKNFLILKPGEVARGVFAGEVFAFKQHWLKAQKRGVVCPGFEKCEICAKVTDDMDDEEKKKYWPGFRFKVNFIVNENGAYTAKILEQGATVYDAIVALAADYDLKKHLIKITRHGSGVDTTYSIVPVANGQLDAEKLALVSQIVLLPLKAKEIKKTEPSESDDEPIF
jgi:hypothetical protein